MNTPFYFDDYANSPRELFYDACRLGDLNMAERIFETGRVVISQKKLHSFAMETALKKKHFHIVKFLISKGAEIPSLASVSKLFRVI